MSKHDPTKMAHQYSHCIECCSAQTNDLKARLAASEKEVERLKTINKDVMASLDRYRASGYELEQRVSELTADLSGCQQQFVARVEASNRHDRALKADLAECEGLLRDIEPWLTEDFALRVAAYFERRKP